MELRNKKTGEIREIKNILIDGMFNVKSLAELADEWEDYEEPKKHHYYIEPRGQVIELSFGYDIDELKEELGEIGNYFKTKEEAEKAVEKLKAWKRLRDEGFKFKSWYGGSKNIDYEITSLENETYIPRQICDDLDLLFGGED